jgi:type IV fimbrial biogenesis protein FimT
MQATERLRRAGDEQAMSTQSPAARSIRNSPRGFTAIELVIVMAIVTVIAAIALPDLSNLLVNQRLRSAGTDLMSSLIVARSEAIKRNGPVEIRPASGVDWTKGWVVSATASNEQLDKRNPLGSNVAVSLAPAFITYQHNGRLTAAATNKVQFNDNRSGSGLPPRCVVIYPSGLPKLSLGACA